ncbi:DNA recombination protein RmuC [Marinomonas posidonica]|uniref:RmuC-domain protein n=1 Tax=Marinomonas posidonica (strain CECT 7376 / NCIMB 14433 / IVIA-Po-181) TaxID=491952 RepID=F6CVB6_MARPP|nr:DNA recombination protein RmuC [Marinomonas posidonica]AEF54226.1 RmuC-domain protein [Marinomonas posidonica IVIA-Po-181]
MTDWLWQSVWAFSGFFTGTLLASIIAALIVQAMRRQWQQSQAKIQQQNEELQRLLGQSKDQQHYLEKESITLEQQFAAAQQVWQEKEAFYREQKKQNEVEFKQLAQDIMNQQGVKLAKENERQLGSLLTPLGTQIQKFQERVEKSYEAEARERFSLAKEIKNLQQLNQKISDDAVSLTHALKGQNKLQGGWGEVILERILERSGLEKGREYQLQASYQTEDGRRLQPDVVIHLPDNKQIVVDSKMVLVSYLAYMEAETEEDRQRALKQHLDAVRRHMKELSAKSYQDLPGVSSLDFVLLFIPIEAAFGLALQADNGLFSEAFEHNIIIVGPSNLLATLRTVQNIWRNEKQSQNAIEIARQAGAMYDKFSGFVQDMDDIGNKLDAVNRSHDAALKKLSTGRGNLLARAEKLKVMGAKTTKALPEAHLNQALESSDEEARHEE